MLYELTKLFLGASESGPYVWGWCQKDEATDAWAVWGTGPNSVLDVEAAAGGSFQYVIGGENGGTGGGGPYPATISQNNITGRNWTTVATLPTNVSNGCAVTLGDTLYIIDGYDYSGSGSAITTMSKMSLTTYIVTSGAGPGSNAYWSATAVVCQNKIYYMGGATTPGTGTSNQCWEYTPGGSPAWVQKANMVNTPSFAQACVYHDTIFVGGGNVGNAAISTVQFYDPDAPGGTRRAMLRSARTSRSLCGAAHRPCLGQASGSSPTAFRTGRSACLSNRWTSRPPRVRGRV